MTGTPIENRLGELWAIMDIVNPGLLGSREWFERTFARPIETSGDERALERLRAIVQPFILRRPKDSRRGRARAAADHDREGLLPARRSSRRASTGRPSTAGCRGSRSTRTASAGAAPCSRCSGQLKQVCNHPEMVLATGRPLDGRSGKLERLVELLEEMPRDDKALVFTQYPGFDRLVPAPRASGSAARSGFFHGRPAARASATSCWPRSPRLTGRRCS